ncbi:MAG: aspartate carbamoyltransferase catalytic subunit [Candidatus Omnitrophica bacterium]|nr:aspartate carbamoyltransferase catalytic subunit [Candidatus Omnitrophota bacterium]MBU1128251.1 aspartate carbamoyltransferase catalytic subunit [Candidatus Omnitrophota bacterium]MBU1656623.1 aspartate carbamoyltransferase catalytic subunit [Candidatus Omnitrophota bacterium]MBU1784837.1 aspartate carbamoyltransferase catalytic subunit [Candidatus Omnitrophota bacterium]MBU1851001.1 aspartate carbamoyltransferase catalytic subunit [Candidatus Omnitrophota bacterium]
MKRRSKTSAARAQWTKKHLLGIEDLTKEEILLILDQAEGFREIIERAIPKVPALRGKTIVNLFCEPSTRTRTSFELAAKRLSADTVNIAMAASSFQKGETLKDTVRNIEAMKIDMVIIRHSSAGVPKFLSGCTKAAIVNAGDGAHEHPTQALLDVFTMRKHLGRIEGLNVSIIGDIAHSRVARSNIWALKKLGANVTVSGPKTMMPARMEEMGVRVVYDIGAAIKGADVLNVLRIQLERQETPLFPGTREYVKCFGIDKERLAKHAKKDVLIMHPGPINRGVELSQDAADGEYSVILDQVKNGVAVRMAVLFLLSVSK